MAGVFSDLLTLFLIFGVVLLIYGWRSGWFLSSLMNASTAQSPFAEPASTTKPKQTQDREPAASAQVTKANGSTGSGAESGRPATDGALAMTPRPDNDAEPVDQPDGVHPAVVAAARQTAIRAAQATFRDHWTVETINARPGWMIFEVSDFLGAPSAAFTYVIPGGGTEEAALDLYPIADVRAAERHNTLIATSRRKVIESRWTKHRMRRQSRGAA